MRSREPETDRAVCKCLVLHNRFSANISILAASPQGLLTRAVMRGAYSGHRIYPEYLGPVRDCDRYVLGVRLCHRQL